VYLASGIDPTTLLGVSCAVILMIVGVAVIIDYDRKKDLTGAGFRRYMQKDSGEPGKEQWIRTMTFSCVKCGATYLSRDELMKHYDLTRHDKYS
jgi:hypothetical protein